MTNQHPITPPSELVEQWRKEPEYTELNKRLTMVTFTTDRLMQLCEKSAQYGADQRGAATEAELQEARDKELDACCEVLHLRDSSYLLPSQLRAARRPKSPSLKEQALTAMLHLQKAAETTIDTIEAVHIICRALEALPND